MSKFIHEELSYAVRGVLYDVHTQLGPMLPEKFYQTAVLAGLEDAGIQCQEEKEFPLHYHNVSVGSYFVDVWIEGGKVLLELKVAPEIMPLHRAQAISYLKVTDADLAFVVNFGQTSLELERLPNFIRDKQAIFSWKKLSTDDMLFPELTNTVLKAMHQVHFELGPGYFHRVYRRATMIGLREQNIAFKYVKHMPVYYRNHYLGEQETRLVDVEGKILLGAVAFRNLEDSMKEQLKARVRHYGVQLGVLANFNSVKLDVHFVR